MFGCVFVCLDVFLDVFLYVWMCFCMFGCISDQAQNHLDGRVYAVKKIRFRQKNMESLLKVVLFPFFFVIWHCCHLFLCFPDSGKYVCVCDDQC